MLVLLGYLQTMEILIGVQTNLFFQYYINMRLYNKLKELASGVTANRSNKGILVVAGNFDGSSSMPFTVNFMNNNGSTFSVSYLLQSDQTVGGVSGNASSNNNMIIPINVHSWTNISPGNSFKVYELY